MGINSPDSYAYEPLDITKNGDLQRLFQSEGITVRRKAETLGRIPSPEEIGQQVTTYVKKSREDFEKMRRGNGYSDEFYEVDDGIIIVESRSPLTSDRVVSRNPIPLGTVDGKTLYNEWTQPIETWMKNYGTMPGTDFAPYKKQATIRLLKVDERIMDILCQDPGATMAKISVSWSANGMDVYKGGYIADAGYGIEQAEFDETYEIV